MKVGIIGCGLIGHKRAESLPSGYLHAVADISLDRARNLAGRYDGVDSYQNWHEIIERDDIDLVVVSTTNNWLAPITLEAVKNGKHVLVEKPAAIHYSELDPVINAARNNGVFVKVGYNLRYHPAIQHAYSIVTTGALGSIMFIRGRYGHGGRLGYEKEWRADPSLSGGGELLDQGVHLIDLTRWFIGDLPFAYGRVHNYFWQMPVEDNCFLSLENESGQSAWLHVSCTEWKNLFSYEIFCLNGKLQVDGIGGSYGTERITCYRMLPKMGPPETKIWEYPFPDISWKMEFLDFEQSIKQGKFNSRDLEDASAVLKIVSKVYGEKKR